jgi:predicted nuclease with TOPRIM domain
MNIELWTGLLSAIAAILIPAVATAWIRIQAGRAELLILRRDSDQIRADVDALTAERDRLRQTLEEQTRALTEQSQRLTATINTLTQMTIERDLFAKKVQTLTEENDMLKREVAALQRRIVDMQGASA